MKNSQSVAVLLMAGGLVLSPATGAATLAQMQQLDAATPPGSRIVCERNYPAQDDVRPALRLVYNAVVTGRKGPRTEFRVGLSFYPSGSSEPDTVIHFTQSVTLGQDEQMEETDPASVSVRLPYGTADDEQQLAARVRREQTAPGQLPYSQIAFTTFPDYVVNIPGIPRGYCRVKTADRA